MLNSKNIKNNLLDFFRPHIYNNSIVNYFHFGSSTHKINIKDHVIDIDLLIICNKIDNNIWDILFSFEYELSKLYKDRKVYLGVFLGPYKPSFNKKTLFIHVNLLTVKDYNKKNIFFKWNMQQLGFSIGEKVLRPTFNDLLLGDYPSINHISTAIKNNNIQIKRIMPYSTNAIYYKLHKQLDIVEYLLFVSIVSAKNHAIILEYSIENMDNTMFLKFYTKNIINDLYFQQIIKSRRDYKLNKKVDNVLLMENTLNWLINLKKNIEDSL